MNTLGVSLIVFAVIFAGAFAGVLLRRGLPEHHLAEGAKDVVRLGTGLIATMAALVLGLLIASAKSSYETQNAQVRSLTANIILLDQVLAQYGPQAREARDLLRRAVDPLADRIWREKGTASAAGAPFEAIPATDAAFAKILELSPQTESQRVLKGRAVQFATDVAQARLALFVEPDRSIPMPFLIVLVFWLTIIFTGFSLFSRLNPTLIAMLFVFALCASGAIYLILEMSQPFVGLMQISSAPLRDALAPLGP